MSPERMTTTMTKKAAIVIIRAESLILRSAKDHFELPPAALGVGPVEYESALVESVRADCAIVRVGPNDIAVYAGSP
jgi:hypothetical protein